MVIRGVLWVLYWLFFLNASSFLALSSFKARLISTRTKWTSSTISSRGELTQLYVKVNIEPEKKKNDKIERFIHPQVYKMFNRAKDLLRNGNNVVAQRLLVRCLELNPYDSHSWLALARLEAKLGNISRARELFVQSLLYCPNNIHILHAWGHMEQKHGNETRARQCWSEALLIDPFNAYVCHALSNLEKSLRNFGRAREVLEKVFLERPTAAICVSLSELERQLGNPDRARDVLVYGLKKCYKDRSKMLLALAWLEEDFFHSTEEACRLLEKAMAEDPANVRVHVAKASMELRLKRIDDARRTLASATRLQAEDGQHYTMWGTLEMESGNYTGARRVLEEGSRAYPGDQFLLQRWGSLEAKYGSASKAREIFARSVSIEPHAPTFVAWAMLEEFMGNVALSPVKPEGYADMTPSEELSVLDLARSSVALPTAAAMLSSKSIDITPALPLAAAQFKDVDASSLHGIAEGANFGPAVNLLIEIEAALNKHQPLAPYSAPSSPLLKSLNQIRDDASRSQSLSVASPVTSSLDQAASICNEGAARDFFVGKYSLLRDKPLIFASPPSKPLKPSKSGVSARHGLPEVSPSPSQSAIEYAHRQYDSARALFSVGMLVDPRHGPLYHAYGNMELRLGNVSGARDIFKRGIAMNCTELTSVYHALGLLELKDDKTELAGQILRRGIELGIRGNCEVEAAIGFLLHSLGMLELDSHNPEEARRLFTTGVSLFPRHSPLLLGLAMADMRLGVEESARKNFREAVDADASHAHAWQAWAIFEKQCGNMEIARALFGQGLKKNPSHGPLWQAFAVMELQIGNVDVARSLFAQGIERCPSHAQSFQAWACLEARNGNLPRARALVMQGLQRVPSHPALWTVAGLVEARIGNYAAAKDIFTVGIERFPSHGALYKVLGELEVRKGAFAEARSAFRAGMAHDRHYAPVYHAAALLEAKVGNLEALHDLHLQAKNQFMQPSLAGGNRFKVAGTTGRGDAIDVVTRIEELVDMARFTPSGAHDRPEQLYAEPLNGLASFERVVGHSSLVGGNSSDYGGLDLFPPDE